MLVFFWGKQSLIIARCLSDAERDNGDLKYKLKVQRAFFGIILEIMLMVIIIMLMMQKIKKELDWYLIK